jgi:hypothetical protein
MCQHGVSVGGVYFMWSQKKEESLPPQNKNQTMINPNPHCLIDITKAAARG